MGKTMRAADSYIREIILQERPDLLAFASPFVGQIWDHKRKRYLPIQPDSIRPLFGLLSKLEEIAEELRIRIVELDESECRRAFLTAVPRKSREIKKAVMRACRLRGWPAGSDHAADALCVSARAWEIHDPGAALTTTPMFSALPMNWETEAKAKPPRPKRKRKSPCAPTRA